MNIELGILHDGSVMMVSDRPLRDFVCRVEYYKDQRLFMLVYDDHDLGDELMHYEIPSDMKSHVEKSPNVILYSLYPNREPIGYKVPLVQIGDSF